MLEINRPFLDLIIGNSFPQITHLNYKFTDYSLNTELSFKFDNLPHLFEFIEQNYMLKNDEKQLLKNVLKELHLKEDEFFYINFYKNVD